MVKKLVVSLALAGALTLGSAAMAGPASAAGKSSCAWAATTLARLQSQEATVSARLVAAKAQLAQPQSTGSLHRLRERVEELTKEQARLAAEVSLLLGRCPGSGTGGGGGPVIVA